MSKIFGIDIANIIHQTMSAGLLPVTLIKVIPGSRTSGSLTSGLNPTTENYTAKGLLIDYNDKEIDGTLVVTGDKSVLLIGASIASLKVPVPGDKVSIEGNTYNIIRVNRDPASATYSCQVRGIPNA